MADVDVKECAECGASIYPEHIGTHKAGLWRGKLVCVHCYQAHQRGQVTIEPHEVTNAAAAAAARPLGQAAAASEPAAATGAGPEPDEHAVEVEATAGLAKSEELEVADDGEEIKFESLAKPKIAPLSSGGGFGAPAAAEPHRRQRALHQSGAGALRCRIFHAKLNDGALKFMEDQINDWIDQSPDIEVKHISTQAGVVEGKSSEQHLIITVFY